MNKFLISSEYHNEKITMNFENSLDARTWVINHLDMSGDDWKIEEIKN